ncbi:hypothetical protein AND_004987 [Anopheles darlingi]|uniref:Uncharacterized protein n=1 Tax=Anopheles darlingi TaxID=43151 RepID=W5JGV4_ANODA|nr:hypothetical protein AND_004987 [Anopheles darlingi]
MLHDTRSKNESSSSFLRDQVNPREDGSKTVRALSSKKCLEFRSRDHNNGLPRGGGPSVRPVPSSSSQRVTQGRADATRRKSRKPASVPSSQVKCQKMDAFNSSGFGASSPSPSSTSPVKTSNAGLGVAPLWLGTLESSRGGRTSAHQTRELLAVFAFCTTSDFLLDSHSPTGQSPGDGDDDDDDDDVSSNRGCSE